MTLTPTLFDISIIQEILPHRSPFLFVDRIIDFEIGHRIVAEKDLTHGEFFFTGHFPGRPVMPGVLVSEALAQASGLLLGLTWKGQAGDGTDLHSGLCLLASLNMKFSNPGKPGETLRLESVLKKGYGKLFLFEVRAYVGGTVIGEGTLTLAEQ